MFHGYSFVRIFVIKPTDPEMGETFQNLGLRITNKTWSLTLQKKQE